MCGWEGRGGRDSSVDGLGTRWAPDRLTNALQLVHFRFDNAFWDPNRPGGVKRVNMIQNLYTTLNEGIQVVNGNKSFTRENDIAHGVRSTSASVKSAILMPKISSTGFSTAWRMTLLGYACRTTPTASIALTR